MRVIAICALVLAACVVAYQLPAQSDPLKRIVRDDFGRSDQSEPTAGRDPNPKNREAGDNRKPPPQLPAIDFEVQATDLGAEFGKALNAAIQDEVINAQQADRLLKDLEVDLTIKRARLDMLRVAATLDKVGKVMPPPQQAGEIMKLRQHLREMVGDLLAPQTGANVPTTVTEREPVGGIKKLD